MFRCMGNKFLSNWDDPYIVWEVYSNGWYKIINKDGVNVGPINGWFLKKYYTWSSLKVLDPYELKLWMTFSKIIIIIIIFATNYVLT